MYRASRKNNPKKTKHTSPPLSFKAPPPSSPHAHSLPRSRAISPSLSSSSISPRLRASSPQTCICFTFLLLLLLIFIDFYLFILTPFPSSLLVPSEIFCDVNEPLLPWLEQGGTLYIQNPQNQFYDKCVTIRSVSHIPKDCDSLMTQTAEEMAEALNEFQRKMYRYKYYPFFFEFIRTNLFSFLPFYSLLTFIKKCHSSKRTLDMELHKTQRNRLPSSFQFRFTPPFSQLLLSPLSHSPPFSPSHPFQHHLRLGLHPNCPYPCPPRKGKNHRKTPKSMSN